MKSSGVPISVLELDKVQFFLGNIHVLRNHKGGREGVSQMLTFAYVGGRGGQESRLNNHILEFFALLLGA